MGLPLMVALTILCTALFAQTRNLRSTPYPFELKTRQLLLRVWHAKPLLDFDLSTKSIKAEG
jgi:hypothetical protein